MTAAQRTLQDRIQGHVNHCATCEDARACDVLADLLADLLAGHGGAQPAPEAVAREALEHAAAHCDHRAMTRGDVLAMDLRDRASDPAKIAGIVEAAKVAR